jgi:aminoglycoside 3-N-acetyltransferase I
MGALARGKNSRRLTTKNMDYSYRQLTGRDLSSFKSLLQVFGLAFNEPSTYGDSIPTDDYLVRLLDSPTFIALAALSGDEVVGGLCAYVLEKFEQKRSEVYIYDLAVAEPHRRKGIATALINALKPIAKGKGAWVIFVQADTGDTPAIKLYESLGTREDAHHFDIPVQ